MLINQDFTVDRTKYIGGSDIGAILSLSKYRTPLQVWLEKTGKETNQVDSLPMRFGSFAEEFVAREYSKATGEDLLHDESIYIHPTHSFMSAHIDRFVLGDESKSKDAGADRAPCKILECKTANPFSQHEWGEAGSDQVPMSYLAQCIWYMAITGMAKTDLAVLFGNSDFRIYHIERDLELEALVLDKAAHFWHACVLADIAPAAQSQADYQALFTKEICGKTVEAKADTAQLIVQLQLLNQEINHQEVQLSEIKQAIMAQMQDAEILTYQGRVLATWKLPKASYRFDSKRFEKESPDVYSQYQIPLQTSRRLLIKEPKQIQYQGNCGIGEAI